MQIGILGTPSASISATPQGIAQAPSHLMEHHVARSIAAARRLYARKTATVMQQRLALDRLTKEYYTVAEEPADIQTVLRLSLST